MSDYTPTTKTVLAYIRGNAVMAGATANEAQDAAVGWLASVERAAAVRALEEFAEQWATRDGIEALMFATDDVSAVRITEKALLARAEVYRREGKK